MRATWERWSDEQIGVELAGTPEELERLAGALMELSRNRDQHFHITGTGKGSTRVADIEISVLPDAGDDSLAVSSFALATGTDVPDPREQVPAARASRRPNLRTAAACLLLLGATLSTVTAYASQFITVAGNDYRPILIEGAWWACLAFVMLQAAALVAREWKLRLVALLGSPVVANAMLGVVDRLALLQRHM